MSLNFTAQIMNEFRDVEDALLRKVLSQVLKRPVTNEDAKDCTMVYREGVHDEYTILYKGHTLGVIKKTFDDVRCSIQFIPKEGQ